MYILTNIIYCILLANMTIIVGLIILDFVSKAISWTGCHLYYGRRLTDMEHVLKFSSETGAYHVVH